MFFDELSNDEWALLAALVSDEPAVRLNRRGRPRAEPRIVANAVLWILTTGEPWSKLPGRYPSGPTCRRRFEEWQLNGTLLEMVRLLSKTGRTFAYVPQPAPPVAAKPAAPVAETPSVRDEGLRGVSWKSPESWQAPGVSSSLSNWRSADPFADITRQLSGMTNAPPVSRTPSASSTSAPPAHRPVMRAGLQSMEEARAVGAAMHSLDSAITSARRTQQLEDQQRSSLSMSLAPRGTQVADRRGYVIYVAAEQVPNAMYRAWAEIMKDGKRVERSGLVGPRFAEADAAEEYALEWARQWIDRECRTQAAAEAAPAVNATAAAAAAARPLPAMRHVPEPVAVNHGGPLHGPLNAFRGPLRRYPSEPAAPATATESSASDRFPSYPELISHAG
ncbi:transposase [Paraburkholderia sp. SEWSISQ10-3 4]|uniref:transposase n=1 Tax=Paraburkholderia TaxID=1822464 RepID=UPI0022503F35|nr:MULTISPECIES: transposase [Paraburkholderia]MCX4138999.1 transposase [Paraburkholderia aspalathi]MDN7171689.1 transposase [Paraburkholderia sp. SEWSISQ10-3 4]MDQ6501328.1 transposase [Paraburkholderia aspalathi]